MSLLVGMCKRRNQANHVHMAASTITAWHPHSLTASIHSPPTAVLQDGSIAYGSHYQNGAGRHKKAVHFRVRLSWAKLELIVVDRPPTRRFAEFRPRQR